MQSIKRLPRSIHSPLRSSVFLFDLPRVVEELIYNSVDAGANKVDVSIKVKACYVKVEDDGGGITRDGLVMLGENCATSKYHLMHGEESSTGNLGFRGEALSSLSDISLVEIRTKARGRPNAYCKIIKGSKCLFLGIDDQRETVGTTVIVRDLFYNQPVRRKCMQSSPKRVLHSVKKCVFRIALVHPHVSFKVTDIESEEELLYTIPSSSPLPLVSDGFGNEVSSCLHEIVFSDQILILSGYISGSTDTLSTKAFQYLYINSRFVNKGPIHNLLNSLAASSQFFLAQQRDEPDFHSRKRHKTLGYPAYLLNLRCPLSIYDLNFEPSKTAVEFKDWRTVLSFFEQAITNFWNKLLQQSSQGNSTADRIDLSLKDKDPIEGTSSMDFRRSTATRKKKSAVDLCQSSQSSSLIADALDISKEDTNADWIHEMPSKDLPSLSSELKLCGSSTGYSHGDAHIDSDCHQYIDEGSFMIKDHLLSDLSPKVRQKYELLNLMPGKEPPISVIFRNSKEDLSKSIMTGNQKFETNAQEIRFPLQCSNILSKPRIERCSFMENKQYVKAYNLFDSTFGIKFGDSRGEFFPDDNLCRMDIDQSEKLSLKDKFHQENVDTSRGSFGLIRKCQTSCPSDRSQSVRSKARLSMKNNSQQDMLEFRESDYKFGPCVRDWCLDSPHSSYARLNEMISDSKRGISEWDVKSVKIVDSWYHETTKDMDGVSGSTQDEFNKDPPIDITSFIRPEISMHYNFGSDEITFESVFASGKSDGEMCLPYLGFPNFRNAECLLKSSCQVQKHHMMMGSFLNNLEFRNCHLFPAHNIRSRRGHSAPPFYKGRHKFSFLNNCLTRIAGKGHDFQFPKVLADSQNDVSQINSSQPCLEISRSEFSDMNSREHYNEKVSTHETKWRCPGESEYATTELTKWQAGAMQPTVGDSSHSFLESNNEILDIRSGILHLFGSSLVPERIDKDCLKDARVLLQLDRKFIPVIASGTLIILDQHAADERIRLEELRRKVLSGEGCEITYLDSEEKLVLPEMSFQLLQKYAEQIQKWGWISNNCSQSSEQFTKNMRLLKRHACVVTLVAVPCILGINLTSKDLIEFIEQLVETDGSSTLPPSVVRILNFKACRGAIMFGDTLLPSECSLIVEELKKTSLCFQCAHGRPTAVPILDIRSLHEQLARLGMQKEALREKWHGLSNHKPSFGRAQMHLNRAKSSHDG
ncbi:DNA mismatch repair protein MLH3 isoform X2 [Typha angustifolia]|uniref:DNA mismatch repair protein MLH3 isoform X2 n=1 Tax=Typha angustifolia TaxID=59011 RepID=UPI003C2D8094